VVGQDHTRARLGNDRNLLHSERLAEMKHQIRVSEPRDPRREHKNETVVMTVSKVAVDLAGLDDVLLALVWPHRSGDVRAALVQD
jgi:hypothetical protein